jgi:signal transduction histidine kinase
MPAPTYQRRPRRLVWRIAGLWMVVFALGLAVIGIVLALTHARAATMRLMAQAEALATRVASEARTQLDRDLRDVFRRIQLTNASLEAWASDGPAYIPSWIDALYVLDGNEILPLVSAPSRIPAPTQLIRERLGGTDAGAVLTSAGGTDFSIHTVDQGDLLLVSTDLIAEQDHRVTAVAQLNPKRLSTDLLGPLVPANAGLGVVDASRAGDPWQQPLSGPLRRWAIGPTEAFVREQRQAVIGQTVIYLGLTVLSFATLLIAMGFLVRLAKREVALAQLKANFVADVSHELKTPLALIRMFGETLQSGRVIDEAKRQEYYAIITRESNRLTNLINNILDFSRIEAGKKEYVLEPTDVGQVVRDTYNAYCPQLEHHQFEHHLTIEPNLPLVHAHPDAVSQAVLNLLSNAIKYSTDEKYVAIEVVRETRRDRHGVLISVHDRGIGIRPEDRARLSEGFFRSQDGRVRQAGGTGLGLALVRQMVEAHNGSFDAEPRLVKGSTFRIFLPAAERQTPAPAGQ